jgi:hypothetical protein
MKESALKFQIELEGIYFLTKVGKPKHSKLTQILDELCAKNSETFKKSEYDLIKSEYHQMTACAKDANMALNWLEEYNRIKMGLITLQIEIMIYRQKNKWEKANQ